MRWIANPVTLVRFQVCAERILRDRLTAGQRALIPLMVVRLHLPEYRCDRSIAGDVWLVMPEEVGSIPTCHPRNYGICREAAKLTRQPGSIGNDGEF